MATQSSSSWARKAQGNHRVLEDDCVKTTHSSRGGGSHNYVALFRVTPIQYHDWIRVLKKWEISKLCIDNLKRVASDIKSGWDCGLGGGCGVHAVRWCARHDGRGVISSSQSEAFAVQKSPFAACMVIVARVEAGRTMCIHGTCNSVAWSCVRLLLNHKVCRLCVCVRALVIHPVNWPFHLLMQFHASCTADRLFGNRILNEWTAHKTAHNK